MCQVEEWMMFDASRRFSRVAVWLALTGWLLAAGVAHAASPEVGLVQAAGPAGCVTPSGSRGLCERGRGLVGNVGAVAVSPDGRNVYALGPGVAVFARDPRTDRLMQLPGRAGCLTGNGPRGACTRVAALGQVAAIAISPDGRSVYLATGTTILSFARGRDGSLRRLPGRQGCVSQTLAACTPGRALDRPSSLAISPDGRDVYVASSTCCRSPSSNAVAVLSRDPATGALDQPAGMLGCVSEGGTEGCASGRGLSLALSVVVSPDGRNVYAGGLGRGGQIGGALTAFARNPATGTLAQLPGTAGCIDQDGSEGCQPLSVLVAYQALAVSPDGRDLYASGQGPIAGSPVITNVVAGFARDQGTGQLTPLPGSAGCVQDLLLGGPSPPCAPFSTYLNMVGGVAVSADGARVYTASGATLQPPGDNIRPGIVAVFARDATSGQFREVPGGCVGGAGCSPSSIVGGASLGDGAQALAIAPDGEALYATATDLPGIAGIEPGRPGGIAVLVRPIVRIATHTVRARRRGMVAVSVRCVAPSGRCSGTLSLSSARPVKLAGRRARTLKLGAARFSIPSGASRLVRVRVPAATLTLLRRARTNSLHVSASALSSAAGHTHLQAAQLIVRVR